MNQVETWSELIEIAVKQLKAMNLGKEYAQRLLFERNEIDKQGAGGYWTRAYNAQTKWEHNKPGLVLPFLLGLTTVDPIKADIKHKITYQPDYPDIDIDFLPIARNPVKAYAEKQYGREYICSVGNWNTYKPKLALQDAASVLGASRNDVMTLTKNLPKEFDDWSYEDAYKELESFRAYADNNPEIVRLAYRMVGKIKSQGRHAGGFIISSVPVREHIPLTLCGSDEDKQWTSAWTEGMKATQLSKFGFVKFDVLGLTNMLYIWEACKLIQSNRGITIDWQDMDPEDERAGWQTFSNGERVKISINDPKAIEMADQLKVDTVFQFETDFQKSVLEKGGVKSFMDLVVYNALGRPGPLPMLDVYIANRDSGGTWRGSMHPKIAALLDDTFGVLVFQEQLTKFWSEICGFTMPEAEAARKAVAKKKKDLLEELEPKVIKGSTPILGADLAREWWEKMISFGRYAFNKSHAVAYTVISYRCLWLKAYYPAEWWSAVLSDCHRDKVPQYMGNARSEGTRFGPINVNHLTKKFTVRGDEVLPGLTSIKGIGDSACQKLVGGGPYRDIDDFVDKIGKNKTVVERLIKLGGFDTISSNRLALWVWYQYRYGSGAEASAIRRRIKCCYAWPMTAIIEERQRQMTEFKRQYPKRQKMPPKIMNWVPTQPWREARPFQLPSETEMESDDNDDEVYALAKKIEPSMAQVISLVTNDFDLSERLTFEKEYLGYYWTSPLDMYIHSKNTTIQAAKLSCTLEGVIENVEHKTSANGKQYIQLRVTDGIQIARVMVWSGEVDGSDPEVFQAGVGVRMSVDWNDKYKSFNVARNCQILPLVKREPGTSVEEESEPQEQPAQDETLQEVQAE